MAGETKVGLLAGLAFIICFAVILANRGRQEFISAQLPSFTSSSVRVNTCARPGPALDWASAKNTAGRQPARPPSARGRATPSGLNRDAFAGGDLRPAEATAAGPTAPHDSPGASGLGESLSAGQPGWTALAAPSFDAVKRGQVLEQKLDELSARGRPDAHNRMPHAAQSGPRPAPVLPAAVPAAAPAPETSAYHTVVAGETLTKIAAEHYGSGSRMCVNAIYDVNRAILSNPDDLRIGMRLALPVIEGINSRVPPGHGTTPASPTRARPPAATTPPVPGAFRWYQIKKDDGYIRIAREQLGDESRWTEIYELNRDKFPDSAVIREGVRIKIPGLNVADARGGRQ